MKKDILDMKTVWVCVNCGDDKIGRSVSGMQYINDDYFVELFDKKTGKWDCRFCGQVEIKEIVR